MPDSKGGPRSSKAADAPKKSAGKTPRAATPRPTQRQVTREGIVRYLRTCAATILWSMEEDTEDWEMVMVEDTVTLLDAMADAIELEADLDPDFPPILLGDVEPRKLV